MNCTKKELSEWAMAVKARDGYICQECGVTSELHSHHIKPKSIFPDLALDVANGVTLCRECHANVHEGKIRSFLLSGRFSSRRPKRSRKTAVVIEPGGRMTPDAFKRWLADMKSAGLAKSDADCARLLGYRDVAIQKRNGGDQRLAMACTAALHRMQAYE